MSICLIPNTQASQLPSQNTSFIEMTVYIFVIKCSLNIVKQMVIINSLTINRIYLLYLLELIYYCIYLFIIIIISSHLLLARE